LNVCVLRKKNRLRDRDTKLCTETKVKELVIGRPPERVIDYVCALEGHSLQHSPVIGNLVRDAVDDDVVLLRLLEADAPDGDHFGGHLPAPLFVDAFYKRFRERHFATG